MCNSLLKPLISRFKEYDMSVFTLIYENFEKLIYLYASRLKGEDAVCELNLFLIELLYSLDLSRFKADNTCEIQKYIAVCLRNKYIALSMRKDKVQKLVLPFYENCEPSYELYDDNVFLNEILGLLTEKQKTVLVYRYIYGYSDVEIGQKLRIKRQAVNRLRNRAFDTLKKCI